MKNIRIFCLKNCHFLVVKFSVYLNRRVFVMSSVILPGTNLFQMAAYNIGVKPSSDNSET